MEVRPARCGPDNRVVATEVVFLPHEVSGRERLIGALLNQQTVKYDASVFPAQIILMGMYRWRDVQGLVTGKRSNAEAVKRRVSDFAQRTHNIEILVPNPEYL